MSLVSYFKKKKEKRRNLIPLPSAPNYDLATTLSSDQTSWVYGIENIGGDFGEDDDSLLPEYSADNSEEVEKVTWKIESSLTVDSNKKIQTLNEMMYILEEFVDHYEGSIKFKPFVDVMVCILGTHMKNTDSGSGTIFGYKSELNEPILFSIIKKLNPHKRDYKFQKQYETHRLGGRQIIELKVKFDQTKRRGIPFEQVYYAPMANSLKPPSLEPLLDRYDHHIRRDEIGSPTLID
ncbi:M protein [Santa barbara virus]|uniref:Matrix protein n=1 Tax=Santa barbara virus TaxID=1552661 RepID=A0A097A5A9_9RHAB|nr:M protein [Santa barbara virus]AIS40847.1 M protein [Santa barbara virus]